MSIVTYSRNIHPCLKVDDSIIKKKGPSLRLWPICLPSGEKKKPGKQTGIHTGWSKPPSFHFLETQAAGYLPFYRDFFKQWHYKMDILECKDPQLSAVLGNPLKHPSNTFYPPATVCARDFSHDSCFTTGESGSPLMMRERTRPMRYYAEGILSFVKGCDIFDIGDIYSNNSVEGWYLNQRTENPSAYTKLSCFLPWIAREYGLEYDHDEETDPACYQGHGDPLDKDRDDCTTIPSRNFDAEVPCIFPFYYDGIKYDECILFEEPGFEYLVFKCPAWNITRKMDGINSYSSEDPTFGLCPISEEEPQLGTVPNSDLDQTKQDCSDSKRRRPFAQCKNNCPGGKNKNKFK